MMSTFSTFSIRPTRFRHYLRSFFERENGLRFALSYQDSIDAGRVVHSSLGFKSSYYVCDRPMSDYNKETAFLRHILCHDTSSESRRVDETIARVHRERACIRKAAVTAAAFVLLAFVFSHTEFFQSEPNFRMWALSVVGLAAMICLVTFLCVLVAYRAKLDRLRDECRNLARNLLETRLIPREQVLPIQTAALPAQATDGTQSSSGNALRPNTFSSGSGPSTFNGDALHL
jgi:hypothetical protein